MDRPKTIKKNTSRIEDSIAVLLSKVKSDTTLNRNQKRSMLYRAFQLVKIPQKDSLSLSYLNDISYHSYITQDSVLFFKSSGKAMTLAKNLGDIQKQADIHWNYGAYYLTDNNLDSSYYHYQKAKQLFERAGNHFFAARMRYNMAYILGRLRDYTGAEVFLFQAIETLEPMEKHKQLYQCYNLLGVVYEELEEYQKSINYHKEALKHLKHLDFKFPFLQDSYNNIGLIYQKQGNHQTAISYFNKALDTKDLKKNDLFLYARLLDNRAFSKLKNNETTNLPQEFMEALHIRDSMGTIPGVIMSRFHLSEFYAKANDTARAFYQARTSYQLAHNIQNNRDILLALELLARLDPKNKDQYLQNYIALNKRVALKERKTRNKFTRIQYETDRYIERNEQLSSEMNWIVAGGMVSVLLVILLFGIHRQNSRNKLLKLEYEQQQANEKIYRLTLQEQEKLQQGRNQERIRISEDLHDSILSDLFALRMGWAYLDLYGQTKELQKHRSNLQELQQIEKKIRELSHDLKNKMIEYPMDFIFIVEGLLQKRSKLGKFNYTFVHDGNIPWEQIDNLIKVHLYHIIEEGLQNCIKHAQASNFSLKFIWHEEQLILKMADDGIGLKTKRPAGIGLKNIKSRVKKMNGTFELESRHGQGTKITISIPLIINRP
ncbi:tetratricopeptide repeat-containing sensor histidine kinase [Yeosuana aromativorans]|nr:tetratricopeptide repeat-containing sensor histidine kinase [Yeosuana aromativorans]